MEEESLFRVAFPEVVESYLRDKALAEENKTKSKTVIYNIHFMKKYTFKYNIMFFSAVQKYLNLSQQTREPPHRLDKLLIKGTWSFDLFFKAVFCSSSDT